jgi:hypothetical protein
MLIRGIFIQILVFQKQINLYEMKKEDKNKILY